MSRHKEILSIMIITAAIAFIPVVNSALADIPVINDEHVVYNLLTLIHNEDRTVVGTSGTYQFSTTLQNDGWYSTTITASDSTKSETVSFLFKGNDDLTFSVVAKEQGINAKFNSNTYTSKYHLNQPNDISKHVSDTQQTDPTALHAYTKQLCPWWSDKWEVKSSQSSYIGKVRVDWDGPSFFWYY